MNPFRIRTFLFISYSSLELKWQKVCSYTPVISSNTIPNSSKMGKAYTRFQTKRLKNHYPVERHIPLSFI